MVGFELGDGDENVGLEDGVGDAVEVGVAGVGLDGFLALVEDAAEEARIHAVEHGVAAEVDDGLAGGVAGLVVHFVAVAVVAEVLADEGAEVEKFDGGFELGFEGVEVLDLEEFGKIGVDGGVVADEDFAVAVEGDVDGFGDGADDFGVGDGGEDVVLAGAGGAVAVGDPVGLDEDLVAGADDVLEGVGGVEAEEVEGLAEGGADGGGVVG